MTGERHTLAGKFNELALEVQYMRGLADKARSLRAHTLSWKIRLGRKPQRYGLSAEPQIRKRSLNTHVRSVQSTPLQFCSWKEIRMSLRAGWTFQTVAITLLIYGTLCLRMNATC